MAKYLRKIFDKNVWTVLKKDNYQSYNWLINSEDIPAEPLVQLRPIRNSVLSFYLIHDDNFNLNQVLAAIGSRLDILDVDYITINDSQLNEEKFNIKQTTGNTLDEQVNKEWHFDLKGLSGFKLVNLAKLFLDKGVTDTCSKYDLIELIKASIDTHRIRLKSCSPEVKKYCAQVTLD